MDRRPQTLTFAALNAGQGALVGVVPALVPTGVLAVDGSLFALAGLMLLAAPALVWGQAAGRRFAAAVCVLYWLAGTVLIALIAASVAYLWGVYGALGQLLAAVSVALGVLVAVAFFLLPAHELVWLRRVDR